MLYPIVGCSVGFVSVLPKTTLRGGIVCNAILHGRKVALIELFIYLGYAACHICLQILKANLKQTVWSNEISLFLIPLNHRLVSAKYLIIKFGV